MSIVAGSDVVGSVILRSFVLASLSATSSLLFSRHFGIAVDARKKRGRKEHRRRSD